MPKNASFFKKVIVFTHSPFSPPFQILLKSVTIMLLTQNFFKTHTHTHYISSSLIISFIENSYSVMNPSQSKETKLKSTAELSLKEKGKGQPSQVFPSKRQRTISLSVPPPSKNPRIASSSVLPQVSRFRDNLQKSRYDLFQGTKYSCGRQVEWEAYKHANFYAEVHKYFEDMG